MSSRGHKHVHVERRTPDTERRWAWVLSVVSVAWFATICWVVIEAWKALGGAFA